MTLPVPVYYTVDNGPGYEGPAFDGDSRPFFYKTQIVYPFWVGTPGDSLSAFYYYPIASREIQLQWNAPGDRKFYSGLDRGVLYPEDSPGVPWNGLTAVTETSSGGSSVPLYLDGQKYSNYPTLEEFQATISAFQYPREFSDCAGISQLSPGLYLGQQPRKSFGLSYRTKIGNDIDGLSHGYILHLVYGATAENSDISHTTNGSTITPISYSWTLTTLPVSFSGNRPSAHLMINSLETPAWILYTIEDMLYGSSTTQPQLPSPADIYELYSL